MIRPLFLIILVVSVFSGCQTSQFSQAKRMGIVDDSYLWLEDIEGDKSLEFVKSENERTLNHFRSNPLFQKIENDARSIYLAKDRVPLVTLKNGELYNFWQDKKNPRGIWRKTTVESYKSKKPRWETLLDIDKLAANENENWVYKWSSTLAPDHTRALVHLSRGGKDATVVREFDLVTKKFVENGFYIPEAKSRVAWNDRDSIFVGTDFGQDSMTDSGYPRIVKLIKRGQKLSEGIVVNEAKKTDMMAYSYVYRADGQSYIFHHIQHGFYSAETWYEDKEGNKFKVTLTDNMVFYGVFNGNLFYEVKKNLGAFKGGSVVYFPLDAVVKGALTREQFKLLFSPSEKRFLQSMTVTKNHILMTISDDILPSVEKVSLQKNGEWLYEKVNLGTNGVAAITSTDEESDLFISSYVDYLTPMTFYLSNANSSKKPEILKRAQSRFNSKNMVSERLEAISKDGTKIPFFVIRKKDLKLDGKNPTILYGYGGFEASMYPFYLSDIGKIWSENGGIYVVANLRGGGEFGPDWHRSVLKENRHKVYDDFISIAEVLISKGYTSPQHLGTMGRSNGGLLTGATFVKRPDLFNAVISAVPLLDMLRYHKLLAGASWMDEYGNPDDPKMREEILKYSPYHNIKKDQKYPEVLIMTSTKDDRVHPGHARKMAARMKEMGHPYYYYENMEGGHAGTANVEQQVFWTALRFTYFWEKLGQ